MPVSVMLRLDCITKSLLTMNVEDLVVKYAGWIKKRARYYYSNDYDADDLASETIYKCLSQSDKFNPNRSFKPWVVSIMENTYKTQYNRRKCVLFTDFEETYPYPGFDNADEYISVKRILEIIERCKVRSRCIECVLLYADGYNYEEIADIIKIPVGTVKSRISAGRKIIRKELGI